MKLTFARKLVLILAGSGMVVTIALAVYLIQAGRQSARERAQAKGVELIERAAEMFMVSTRKFHDLYTNAPNEVFRKGVVDDWNRTILAVDTAVINDFGPEKPRVRLIGDQAITKVKPLGGDAIAIKTPFEEIALKEIMAGKERVEEFTEDSYKVAMPLLNSMHPGCAECHGISVDGRIVMGSVNAYIPLAADYAQARHQVVAIGLFVGVAMLALVGCIGLFVHRSMVKPVKTLSELLFSSAEQTAGAASQVATASASLAQGASDQAASLEETSASLEEMSSMTRSNAERAKEATALARSARTAADEGAAQMQSMATAMTEIKTSSDEIAKIIKTIDEIAFQTNILALNAAVEAARAGDAGMGFAVVADEVRNLAQRSAQAARETTAKIESAISKTAQGGHISEQVLTTLENIVSKVRKVDELIAEVATASSEQKQGIEQVNTAIGRMDHVTQSTAASAEESASAAEELNSQAASLKDAITQLLRLVGDGNGGQAQAELLPMPEPALATRERAFQRSALKPGKNSCALENARDTSQTHALKVGGRAMVKRSGVEPSKGNGHIEGPILPESRRGKRSAEEHRDDEFMNF